MECNKKQSVKQTSELTKKDLIEIVKDTVAQQIAAYDNKQKRKHAGSLIAKFFRLLIVGGILAAVAYFTQFASSPEDDEEENAEEDTDISSIN